MTRTFDSRRWHPVGWLLLLTVLLVPLGCSFSASSKSLSDSSASSSKSSSDSSASSSASSSPGDSAYYDDVRSTTETYAKSGGPFDAYQKKLGDLAKDRGVTNWEENLGTYAAIGEGLGQARLHPGADPEGHRRCEIGRASLRPLEVDDDLLGSPLTRRAASSLQSF